MNEDHPTHDADIERQMPQYQPAILQLVGLLQADKRFLFVSVFGCGAAQLLVDAPFGFRVVPFSARGPAENSNV